MPPYIGEIRMFAGNFPPNGWKFCDGSLMPISENDALFTLIGTTYGGDGEETFALPNLLGRVPVHMGQGPGLSQNYLIGEMAGVESVTLTTQQIPNHSHSFVVSTDTGTVSTPANAVLGSAPTVQLYRAGTPSQAFNPGAVTPVGGSQPHENMQPFTVINYIISLFGVFPQQT